MTHLYEGFAIECFEAGRGLWHARIRRADLKPLVIEGEAFPVLEMGIAWPDQQAAVADAMGHIDRDQRHWSNPEPMPNGLPSAA